MKTCAPAGSPPTGSLSKFHFPGADVVDADGAATAGFGTAADGEGPAAAVGLADWDDSAADAGVGALVVALDDGGAEVGWFCGALHAAAMSKAVRVTIAANKRELAVVVSPREFVFVTVGSVVLSLVILAALWPWIRRPRTLAAVALSVAVGIIVWNALLDLTNATSLNVDSPLLGLSVQDVGSGVAAFLVTLIVLRFVTDRTMPASRALGIAIIVGIVTVVVDLFG